MEIKEGKRKKGGVGRRPRTRRPSQPRGQAGRKPRFAPKPFVCSCGAQFFECTNKKKVACIKCKGIAKESKYDIHPKPIWKEVKSVEPFCPRCGSRMRPVTNADVATMFDWQCTNILGCNYVC